MLEEKDIDGLKNTIPMLLHALQRRFDCIGLAALEKYVCLLCNHDRLMALKFGYQIIALAAAQADENEIIHKPVPLNPLMTGIMYTLLYPTIFDHSVTEDDSDCDSQPDENSPNALSSSLLVGSSQCFKSIAVSYKKGSDQFSEIGKMIPLMEANKIAKKSIENGAACDARINSMREAIRVSVGTYECGLAMIDLEM
jgi:hypothetical protein